MRFVVLIALSVLLKETQSKVVVNDASKRAFVRGMMRNGEDPTTLTQMALGESSCTSVRPSFCTMVDWEVSSDLGIVKNGFGDVELGIEMAYFQQPGSFDCRRRYKQP